MRTLSSHVPTRHALSVSLWTGLIVALCGGGIVATRVIGFSMPDVVQEARLDPRAIFPDTTDVVRETLDVRPPKPAETRSGLFTYAFAPSSFDTAYRPMSETVPLEADSPSPVAYSDATAVTGDRPVVIYTNSVQTADLSPRAGVTVCTDTCRDAEAVARNTVDNTAEPLSEAAPVISAPQAPVVPASEGAPVIVETN
ncbi:hypothetical protein PQU92_09390 [Asticcacaulis sp. BYS171W]|uniref:Uncharacterized protein n=1 Tax=Asticcacaulis aquaticus TaxID=2984212 RepID=A0ABT5HTT9_9CAUL|nr:hypothetical protein [Asticcacaulis aquaticus]MDC7683488.1 hypothetical protein [Asticcacaulis aquaticus]